MLSGNTDCYQPIERKLKITRSLLEAFLQYKNPVSIITKNNLILRDIDLLTALAAQNLIHVNVSVTSMREDLRQKLEPRTVTGAGRIMVIQKLAEKGIPVRVMVAPIISGLNSEEISKVIKAAADAGAIAAGYTIVRLNGSIAELFIDWIHKTFPDRVEKVLHSIADCHGGTLNDSRWDIRMKGEGNIAVAIQQLFKISCNRYLTGCGMPEYNLNSFTPKNGTQIKLF